MPLDDQLHAVFRTDDLPSHQSQRSIKKSCTYRSPVLDLQAKEFKQELKKRHIRLRRNVINETKYVELVIVNDKRSFDFLGGDLNSVEGHSIQVNVHRPLVEFASIKYDFHRKSP